MDELERFARLKFKGDRFEGASMPVAALEELVAYRDAVWEVARHIYLDKNPQRQKVPYGLKASFDLALTGIEDGSSIAVLAITLAAISPEHRDVFHEARATIENIVDAATAGRELPDIAYRVTPQLQRLGKSLQDDEYVFLRAAQQPGEPDEIRFDRGIKETLLIALDAPTSEHWAEVDWIGSVVSADREQRRFEFRRVSGGRKFPFVVDDQSMFMKLFDWTRDEQMVRIRGRAQFRDTRFQTLDVKTVVVADPGMGDDINGCSIPIIDQFKQLASLADGWLDGEGTAYSVTFLQEAEHLVRYLVDVVGLPVPYLYPTADGELRIEWPSQRWEIVVHLADADYATLTACEIDSHRLIEKELSVRRRSDKDDIGNEIMALFREVPT